MTDELTEIIIQDERGAPVARIESESGRAPRVFIKRSVRDGAERAGVEREIAKRLDDMNTSPDCADWFVED